MQAESQVEKLNSSGKQFFERKYFSEALEKYEHCLLYCDRYSLSARLKARAHSNHALASLKLVELSTTLDKRQKIIYLQDVIEDCDQCLELKKYLPKVRVFRNKYDLFIITRLPRI